MSCNKSLKIRTIHLLIYYFILEDISKMSVINFYLLLFFFIESGKTANNDELN